MNPVTVRIFDVNRSKQVQSHFYDMCTTSGEDCGKAAAIFNVMDQKFQNDSMPWLNAVSLSVDNTNSMVGCNNSIASRCKEIFLFLVVHAILLTLLQLKQMMVSQKSLA